MKRRTPTRRPHLQVKTWPMTKSIGRIFSFPFLLQLWKHYGKLFMKNAISWFLVCWQLDLTRLSWCISEDSQNLMTFLCNWCELYVLKRSTANLDSSLLNTFHSHITCTCTDPPLKEATQYVWRALSEYYHFLIVKIDNTVLLFKCSITRNKPSISGTSIAKSSQFTR